MDLPIVIKSIIEKELDGVSQKNLQEIMRKISLNYLDNNGKGKKLVSTSQEVAVYASVRMPATFGAVSQSLEYALECYKGEEIKSVLDIGAGTGAGTISADMLLNLTSATCIEREKEMSNLGKKLLSLGSDALQNAIWVDKDVFNNQNNFCAQLIIASYLLNELLEENRYKLLDRLWEADFKILLIVEPGTPQAFKNLQKIKNYLLLKGGKIIAPCPNTEKCELSDEDWCHFTCRIPRSKMHKYLKGGEAPYEDEKFCFVAISKEDGNNTMGRVLRHPFIEKGKITLQICTNMGICTKIIRKKDGEIFKTAKKMVCGSRFTEIINH